MSGLFDALFPRGPALERVLLRTGAGRVLCYRDALEASARIAHALRGLGVRPVDRVAVQVEKSPEAVMLYLACLRLGAVYLPLNPLYTPAEIEYLLADSMPALFVCAPGRGAELAPLAQRLGVPAVVTLGAGDGAAAAPGSLMEAAGACPAQFATVARAAQDPAAILYTSGTTGRPKGAMLKQGNLLSNARTLAELWDFSSADVLLHALPIFHVHGLFVAINVTLAAGSSMIFLPRFEVAEVLRQLDAATVLLGVPTFYVRLLADPRLNPGLTARCRLFISGSAPLLPETHRAWRERTGHALLERYGMTETGMISSNPLQGERRAGSVGLALPGVQVRITDPASGAPLGTEAVGLIEVRGPNVFAGYWRAPEQTRGVPGRRLLHDRGPGAHRRARLPVDRRPGAGSDHQRRLQRVSEGSGTAARCAARGA